MLRHEFRPGKLVVGASFMLAGILYAGDAGGAWETPWFALIPLLMVGLCLAGVTGAVAGALRRRRGPGRGGGAGEAPRSPVDGRPDTVV